MAADEDKRAEGERSLPAEQDRTKERGHRDPNAEPWYERDPKGHRPVLDQANQAPDTTRGNDI